MRFFKSLACLYISAVVASVVLPERAHAVRVHLFDIDGTLVHDSGLDENGKKPAWWTYWVLDRVPSLNNGWHLDHAKRLLSANKLPDRIYLNKNEVDRLRDHFATRNERVGNPDPIELDNDPIRENLLPHIKIFRPRFIYPGYYSVDEAIAYSLHRDSFGQPSPLLETYKMAVTRARKDPANLEWRGPAFPYFKNAIANQGPDERVYFLSDRDHMDGSYLNWAEAMNRDKFISAPVKEIPVVLESGEVTMIKYFPKSISTSSISARSYGSAFDFETRKANAIIDRAMQISRSPLQKQMVIGSDYNDAQKGIRRPMHEIFFYENKPEYIREIVKIVKKNAGHFPDIKFIFYHAGELESVSSLLPYAPRPEAGAHKRFFVLTPSGTGLRSLTVAEHAELNVKENDCLLDLIASKK